MIFGGGKECLGKIYRAYCQRKERIVYKQLWDFLRKFPLFQNWFYSLFALSEIEFENNVENIILLVNSGLVNGYTHQYLTWLKKRIPNVHFILYMMDPIDIFFKSICDDKSVLEVFDIIYNINKMDSIRYGHKYWPLVLSKKEVTQNGKIDNSLYFCGWGKDRVKELQKIYYECNKRDIRTNFKVLYSLNEKFDGIEIIEEPIDYEENLKNILESGCMLELMHHGYDNPTQRYPEAVLYNKKLLSNNESIIKFPYYNSNYMRIFHDVEEIDWEWLSKEEEVDYNYQGDFSPIMLIEDILKSI